MKKSAKMIVAMSAMTGLVAGLVGCSKSEAPAGGTPTPTPAAGAAVEKKDIDKHDCKGQNTCKGLGGCKTGDNGCKGKNTCKGKGGCKVA